MDYADYDYINLVDVDGNWATIYECSVCGAAVRNTDKHTAWHEQVIIVWAAAW